MKKLLINLSLIAFLVTVSSADEAKKRVELTEKEKQEMIANSTFEMPSAGALVNSLTKNIGSIDWNSFMAPVTNKKYTSNEDKVLNLGVRGADAYFLTKSKDSANLIAISTEINYLLNEIQLNNKSLNTSSRKAKLKVLKNLVKNKNWVEVQKEITILQNSINNDFVNANNQSLVLLNNVGGWIEGYRLAVEGFNKNYKADKTDILLQNELIDYLLSQLKNDNNLKSFTKTKSLLKTLTELNIVLKSVKNDALTKAQVSELLKILSVTKQYI